MSRLPRREAQWFSYHDCMTQYVCVLSCLISVVLDRKAKDALGLVACDQVHLSIEPGVLGRQRHNLMPTVNKNWCQDILFLTDIGFYWSYELLFVSFWQPCDELVTCWGCTAPLTQCQLGSAPAPCNPPNDEYTCWTPVSISCCKHISWSSSQKPFLLYW